MSDVATMNAARAARRVENVKRAQALRAEGLLLREIAERMGLAVQTVGAYLVDPDQSKERERKLRNARLCLGGCGRTVNTDGRATDPGLRCKVCNAEHQKAMSRVFIGDSLKEWVERFGSCPSAEDWNPAQARSRGCLWKVDRYAATGRPWPSPSLVMNLYGSWNAGLAAFGYPTVAQGQYRSERQNWTRESILAAIGEWFDANGRMPTSQGWRNAGPGHPCYGTVVNTFGSWGEALRCYVEDYLPDSVAA